MKNLINSLGIAITVIGTVLTLWTTFITKTSEAGTHGEMARRHEVFPKEKKRVVVGCCLIIIGGMAQIISQFI